MITPKETYQRLKEIIKNPIQTKITNFEMAFQLLKLKDNDGFKEVIGEDKSWKDFIKSIGKAPSTIERYMKIVDVYIRGLGMKYSAIADLDTWSLYCVANKGKINKDNWFKWLGDIKKLSRSEIEALTEDTGVYKENCHHNLKRLPSKFKCSRCGIITNKK